MKMTIQVLIEEENLPPALVKSFSVERKDEDLCLETLGLKLEEGKETQAEIQSVFVPAQAKRFLECHSSCLDCGMSYAKNGTHQLTFRTLFGTIKLTSQRFSSCPCPQAKAERQGQKLLSFSPLATLFSERAAPELVGSLSFGVILGHERMCQASWHTTFKGSLKQAQVLAGSAPRGFQRVRWREKMTGTQRFFSSCRERRNPLYSLSRYRCPDRTCQSSMQSSTVG